MRRPQLRSSAGIVALPAERSGISATFLIQVDRICLRSDLVTLTGFAKLGAKTLHIEPCSPWENGLCESCNGKLRDECPDGEIFYSLKEATVVIEHGCG